MPVTYSSDLRIKVLAAYERGMKTKEIAEAFGTSGSWTRRVRQRFRELGETEARPRVRKQLVYKLHDEMLIELLENQPDATLAELVERLAERGVECSESGVDTALKRMGYSYKKRQSTPPSRSGPTSPRRGRCGARRRARSTGSG